MVLNSMKSKETIKINKVDIYEWTWKDIQWYIHVYNFKKAICRKMCELWFYFMFKLHVFHINESVKTHSQAHTRISSLRDAGLLSVPYVWQHYL